MFRGVCLSNNNDWDELATNKNRNRRKKSKRKQTKEQASLEKEDRDYINSLADSKGQYEWMKEKRFKTIFRDIRK